MSDDRLFAVPEPIAPLDSHGKVSATRRRTIRNRELIAAGVHPATRRPLIDGEKCGGCAHCSRVRIPSGKAFWKCARHRLGQSHSEASDIRRSWPACEFFTHPSNPQEH